MPDDDSNESIPQEVWDELKQQLGAAVHAHNTAGQDEMGGLSPDQVRRLITAQWGEPDSPVQFNADIPLFELERSDIFCRMRTLLKKLHESGGVKATSGKNLPRRFVADTMPLMVDEKTQERIWAVNKTVNEQDVWPLHLARVGAQAAGMIRFYKGRLVVPKSKTKMLADKRAGELFCCLFVGFFRRFNLAYLAPIGPEAEAMQHCAAYTLYRLGRVATALRSVDDLSAEVLLPFVRFQVEQDLPENGILTVDKLLVHHLLMPLVEWGLLEGRYKEEFKGLPPTLKQVRTTPLYEKFVEIDI